MKHCSLRTTVDGHWLIRLAILDCQFVFVLDTLDKSSHGQTRLRRSFHRIYAANRTIVWAVLSSYVAWFKFSITNMHISILYMCTLTFKVTLPICYKLYIVNIFYPLFYNILLLYTFLMLVFTGYIWVFVTRACNHFTSSGHASFISHLIHYKNKLTTCILFCIAFILICNCVINSILHLLRSILNLVFFSIYMVYINIFYSTKVTTGNE